MGVEHCCPCGLTPGAARLCLLGGFELRCMSRTVPLPLAGQRVLAFLSAHEVPILRAYVAEALWPDSHRHRAGANLRSAVWRIRQTGHHLIEGGSRRLSLARGVSVDLRDRDRMARRLLSRDAEVRPAELEPEFARDFSVELLPDWYDEWLFIERDRWNQLRLHALEALAEKLLAAGELSLAVQAALAAIAAEPLRESAHRVLIRIFAAEGNWSEAVAQYRSYRQLLQRELCAPPTAQMEDLIRAITPR
jgi:DNA-binding SARP family transcriptional activator